MYSALKTICQCLCFSEDNCPVLWRQLGSAHFRGDNCPLIWRQFGSALFSVKTIFQCSIFLYFSQFFVKTIVLLLLILWRQLYYCYLFCEDNCTSAHEDNFTSEDNCTISHEIGLMKNTRHEGIASEKSKDGIFLI